MRWLIPWFAIAVSAQSFRVTPATVRQGDTIRLVADTRAAAARMNGRRVPLFQHSDGTKSGLMPVPALEPPGQYTLEFLDSEGRAIQSTPVTVRDARFPAQNVVIDPAVRALPPSPGEADTVAELRNTVTEVRHWEEPFVAPVPGCMNSPFGVKRLYNGQLSGNYHSGVDQRSPAGRPIRAIAGGVVKFVRTFNIHGNTVGIDHGQGVTSVYLHMSKFATKEGATVKKGDVIGYVGATGRANGPHLHWTLNVNGVPVNPRQWVRLQPCSAAAKGRRGPKN